MTMDPNRLRLAHRPVRPTQVATRKAPRHQPTERFLRGPIPWIWLCQATKAAGRGSGLQVALALWFLAGLNRQAGTVKLSGTVLRELGVLRHAAYRGLRALEQAGLVAVQRQDGQSPVVTLLEPRIAP